MAFFRELHNLTTMSRVSLELLKKHVRADDFADDDIYLTHILKAAEQQVEGLLNYTPEELATIADEDWPDTLRHAVLLRAGTMYAYREDVDSGALAPLPNSLMAIIKPYQKQNGGGLLAHIMGEPDHGEDEGGESASIEPITPEEVEEMWSA